MSKVLIGLIILFMVACESAGPPRMQSDKEGRWFKSCYHGFRFIERRRGHGMTQLIGKDGRPILCREEEKKPDYPSHVESKIKCPRCSDEDEVK